MTKALLILFIFLSIQLDAHLLDKIDREVIVKVNSYNFSLKYLESLFPKTKISLTSEMLHLWKISYQDSIPFDYLNKLKSEGKITSYFRNKRLSPRASSPNDTLFSLQWHHQNNKNVNGIPYGISSVEAWDLKKSGVTAKGDTIVVAVLDFGFDTFHQDLDYFINRNEIPYDTIDNDSNGAKDDYLGWNVDDNNHILIYSGGNVTHGMSACGGIAARGNNVTGVAGVAWNTKILPMSNLADFELSIKAFEYCIKMKRIYLSTNGMKGAYIVAINYSLGAEGLDPIDFPEWCAIFDSLGSVGIIASCAVANNSGDSETIKDMPILCNSPFMINVTTYHQLNLGLDGSAYSKKFVHLAAPHKYHTVKPNNSYGNSSSGASFAAPIVSGAIALMYANFTKEFLDTLHSNFPKGTSLIKKSILQKVDITPGLTGKLVSDGKLNLGKTIAVAATLQDTLRPRSSISNSDYLEIKIYSFDKKIVVKKSNHLPLILTLYNLLGQEIIRKMIIQNEEIIESSNLNSNIYIAKYQSGDKIYTKKLVIN